MDSKTKTDPFELLNPKKVKIKEYLVFKASDEEESNYIIKEVTDSKSHNLIILQYLQKLIKSSPDINSEEVFYYLKQQRNIMKRYLKEVNKD